MKKFMKTMGIIMIMSLTILSVTACGKDTTDPKNTEEIQTEGLETLETEEATKPYFEETREIVELDVPTDIDGMRPVMYGLCKAMTKGTVYDPANGEFFWNAIYASINGNTWIHPNISLSDDGAGYMVPKAVVEEYAAAMFADVSELPELPSNMGSIEYDEETGSYMIYSAGGISGVMDITSVDEIENGYKVMVAFNTKNGLVENHTFMMNNGGTGSFTCSIYSVAE